MNIKKLNIFKNSGIKTRLCAFTLAGTMVATMTGCSNSKSNNSSESQYQTSISVEFNEDLNTYLDNESYEIHSVESLLNGEKRGILLSDEPHLYKSLFEQTDTKVYLSDENGNRLSNNFDRFNKLSDYRYLTSGGLFLGDILKVKTDRQYDLFVGVTLQEDSNGSTLGQNITLLDKNGAELCTFNGEFQALFGTILVISDYFEGEDRVVGVPRTYLYDYATGKTSEKHDYVKIVRLKNNQNEENTHLVGVNFYYDNDSCFSKNLYSFYDENLEIIAISTDEEIKEWYIRNDDYSSFRNADGNYSAYFKSIYDNAKNTERGSGLILQKQQNTN